MQRTFLFVLAAMSAAVSIGTGIAWGVTASVENSTKEHHMRVSSVNITFTEGVRLFAKSCSSRLVKPRPACPINFRTTNFNESECDLPKQCRKCVCDNGKTYGNARRCRRGCPGRCGCRDVPEVASSERCTYSTRTVVFDDAGGVIIQAPPCNMDFSPLVVEVDAVYKVYIHDGSLSFHPPKSSYPFMVATSVFLSLMWACLIGACNSHKPDAKTVADTGDFTVSETGVQTVVDTGGFTVIKTPDVGSKRSAPLPPSRDRTPISFIPDASHGGGWYGTGGTVGRSGRMIRSWVEAGVR